MYSKYVISSGKSRATDRRVYSGIEYISLNTLHICVSLATANSRGHMESLRFTIRKSCSHSIEQCF